LMKVDFPTFGRPMIEIKPDLYVGCSMQILR